MVEKIGAIVYSNDIIGALFLLSNFVNNYMLISY